MAYDVLLKPAVQKDLDSFPDDQVVYILRRLSILAENPRPFGVQKLSTNQEQYRIRVGRYRILFEIDDSRHTVQIFRIKHRKDAYRKK